MSSPLFDHLPQQALTTLGKSSIISRLSEETLQGPMRGWLCGHFYPRDSVFHRKDIEICVKKLPVGTVEEPHFHLCSFEFLIVLEGSVSYNISGNQHRLTPGMFYMLEPGEVEHIVEVHEETTLLAVRLPSIPNNKIPVRGEDRP
jgi:mannose-6-phosphate isomerase-like protein (cupin superfamily)